MTAGDGYNCAACGAFVFWNQSHSCPTNTPTPTHRITMPPDPYAAQRIAELEAECERLTRELRDNDVRNMNIVEAAVRSSPISDYVDHWESRATKAEADVGRMAIEHAKERAAHAETRREVGRLNSIVIPHARKQENASGFQRGWHAVLTRLSEGDSLETLMALVPRKVDPYGKPE